MQKICDPISNTAYVAVKMFYNETLFGLQRTGLTDLGL